jgi:ATP-dependent Clp protease ATP-binding subunit ClpC
VEAAVEEARVLGHDTVGDEDLLMGILRTDEGLGAAALSSLGVTLGGAREESEHLFSEALTSIGVSLEQVRREAGDAFEMPFSPRVKKALEQALREAVRLRNNRIGTEHVLLEILRNEDGTAVRILASMGLSPEMLEDRVLDLRGRAAG